MTNKDFKEGMEQAETTADKLRNDLKNTYSNLEEPAHYEYSVNYPPKPRTIDDLECGDYVVDNSDNKKRCLGRCGEICFLSSSIRYDIDGNEIYGWEKEYWEAKSLFNLKNNRYTLYQQTEEKEKTLREKILELMRDGDTEWACDEIIKLKENETDIDKCIKVVEEYFGKDYHTSLKIDLVQALKNLKK